MAQPAKFLSDLYSDPKLQNNCSGFFRAALNFLKITPPNVDADRLIDLIGSSPAEWVLIGKGTPAGKLAAEYARRGHLVVAVLKASEHCQFKFNKATQKYDIPDPRKNGHTSIVLPGLGQEGYPLVISGSIVEAGKSDGARSVREVWRGIDAPNVRYYRTHKTFPELRNEKKEQECGIPHSSIEDAIAHARRNLGGDDVEPYWGTMSSNNVGWVVGYQVSPRRRWRLDFDPDKLVHVNEENFDEPPSRQKVIHKVLSGAYGQSGLPIGNDTQVRLYWHKWTSRYNGKNSFGR